MNELALFAGAGGGILGGKLLGWTTVCAVEFDPYAASVLIARQNDGILPPFPIWDDVRTFDGRPWSGRVDVVSGGFPCQDISIAGKGAGIAGERSGLWSHMARIVGEVEPAYVFVENSSMLVVRGLERVVSDLAAMGYGCRWGVLGAADVGAKHQRDRIWIVAHSYKVRCVHPADDAARRRHDPSGCVWEGQEGASGWPDSFDGSFSPGYVSDREIADGKGIREDHALADWVDRVKVIGNGQVPLCAATAWHLLTAQP